MTTTRTFDLYRERGPNSRERLCSVEVGVLSVLPGAMMEVANHYGTGCPLVAVDRADDQPTLRLTVEWLDGDED